MLRGTLLESCLGPLAIYGIHQETETGTSVSSNCLKIGLDWGGAIIRVRF